MTSTEQLNALIAAGNEWQAQAQALLADRLAHQAAYEALANNLRGVVAGEMLFTGIVDPDDPAPTEVDNGVFNTIKDVIQAAPSGAYVVIKLLAGKSYATQSDFDVYNKSLQFIKEGPGNNPVITPMAEANATHNFLEGFKLRGSSRAHFYSVDIALPTAKVDAGLAWSASSSLVRFYNGSQNFLGFHGGTITGGEGLALMSNAAGNISLLSIDTATLDGAIYGIRDTGSGVALIAQRTVTLLNGAALTDGGTIGTNILQN